VWEGGGLTGDEIVARWAGSKDGKKGVAEHCARGRGGWMRNREASDKWEKMSARAVRIKDRAVLGEVRRGKGG